MSLFDDFCDRVSAGRIQCQRGLCIAAGTQLALPQQFLRQLVILSFFHVMAKVPTGDIGGALVIWAVMLSSPDWAGDFRRLIVF
jgi:hypothetical protein